nr:ATP-binding protein [uncultured Methanoregula sp.]
MSNSLINSLKNKIGAFLIKDNIDIEMYAEIPLLIIAGPTIGIDIHKKNEIGKLTPEEEEGLKILARTIGKSLEELTNSIEAVLRSNSRDDIQKLFDKIEKLEQNSDDIHREFSRIRNLLNPTILISPKEFELRTENRSLLKSSFLTFVGRNPELSVLREFLNDERKSFCLIHGKGGSGKTRLALEFAKETTVHDKKWDVFFLDRFKSFTNINIEKNTLVILDETSRYQYKPSLYSYIANFRRKGILLKLVLIDRSIFKSTLSAELKEFDVDFTEIRVANADIKTAIIQNFEIPEYNAGLIERSCAENFIFAEIIVTYFRDTGEIDLQNAVEYRISKYVKDLNLKNDGKYDVASINKILQFLSIVHELDPENDKELLKQFEKTNKRTYDTLKELLLESDNDEYIESDLIVFSERGTFSIIFDPLSDYFVYRFLKENNQRQEQFKKKIVELLKYKPYFITQNFLNFSDGEKWFLIDDNDLIFIREIISTIWDYLNSNPGISPEYFEAIRNLSAYNLAIDPSLNSKANYLIWEKSYEQIVSLNQSTYIETTAEYARCLFNAAYWKKDEKELYDVQQKIKQLAETAKSEVIIEIYAKYLVNCFVWIKQICRKEVNSNFSSEILKLHNENLDSETITIEYVKFLANRLRFNQCNVNWDKINEEIEEIEVAYEKFNDEPIRILFSNYLSRVSYLLSPSKSSKDIEEIHEKIQNFFYDSAESKFIGEYLAESFFNLSYHYTFNKKWDLQTNAILKICELFENHYEINQMSPTFSIGFQDLFKFLQKERNPTRICTILHQIKEIAGYRKYSSFISVLYLNCIFNALILFTKKKQSGYQKKIMRELGNLYPFIEDNQELVQVYAVALHQTFVYYNKNKIRWNEKGEILINMKKAANRYPDSAEISGCYIDSLFNMFFSKGRTDLPHQYFYDLYQIRNLIPIEVENREKMIMEIEEYNDRYQKIC